MNDEEKLEEGYQILGDICDQIDYLYGWDNHLSKFSEDEIVEIFMGEF
jgi:diaminopimelate decarboxylase